MDEHVADSDVGLQTDRLVTRAESRTGRLRAARTACLVEHLAGVVGGARLLRALTGQGLDLVLVGDPDATVQGFRGADPHHLVDDWRGRATTTHVLGQGHRLPERVHAAAARVVPKIAALGGGRQRGASPAAPGGEVEAHVLHSSAQEAAFVAHELRATHLLGGVPWRQLAVVVRGSARQAVMTCSASRVVTRARAGSCSVSSVNDRRGHNDSRQA